MVPVPKETQFAISMLCTTKKTKFARIRVKYAIILLLCLPKKGKNVTLIY